MLFSQLLRAPAPAHKPLAYAALMVDLCKLMPTFPRSMSTCVRECFSRCVAARGIDAIWYWLRHGPTGLGLTSSWDPIGTIIGAHISGLPPTRFFTLAVDTCVVCIAEC